MHVRDQQRIDGLQTYYHDFFKPNKQFVHV